jgi:spore coat protein U-like protein
MRKYILPLSFAALAAASSSALAVTTSDNFQTRINILTSCAVTANDVDFGNVGVIAGGESASGSVSVNCSAGTAYTLSFDAAGTIFNYAGNMTDGTSNVAYSAALSGAGGVGPGNFTVNAVLPAQVTPAPGIYTDNRTVYVNY